MVKPINLRKNVDISGPAVNVHGNSLSMRRESLSSRVRNNFIILSNFKRQLKTLFLTVLSLLHPKMPLSRQLLSILKDLAAKASILAKYY